VFVYLFIAVLEFEQEIVLPRHTSSLKSLFFPKGSVIARFWYYEIFFPNVIEEFSTLV
jgi:hypothetical protein